MTSPIGALLSPIAGALQGTHNRQLREFEMAEILRRAAIENDRNQREAGLYGANMGRINAQTAAATETAQRAAERERRQQEFYARVQQQGGELTPELIFEAAQLDIDLGGVGSALNSLRDRAPTVDQMTPEEFNKHLERQRLLNPNRFRTSGGGTTPGQVDVGKVLSAANAAINQNEGTLQRTPLPKRPTGSMMAVGGPDEQRFLADSTKVAGHRRLIQQRSDSLQKTADMAAQFQATGTQPDASVVWPKIPPSANAPPTDEPALTSGPIRSLPHTILYPERLARLDSTRQAAYRQQAQVLDQKVRQLVAAGVDPKIVVASAAAELRQLQAQFGLEGQ